MTRRMTSGFACGALWGCALLLMVAALVIYVTGPPHGATLTAAASIATALGALGATISRSTERVLALERLNLRR